MKHVALTRFVSPNVKNSFFSNLINFFLSFYFSNVAGGPNSTTSTLKAARAALMLIPILGIHFILLPIRPEQGSTLEYVYEVVSAVSSSYQVCLKELLSMNPLYYSVRGIITGQWVYLITLRVNFITPNVSIFAS